MDMENVMFCVVIATKEVTVKVSHGFGLFIKSDNHSLPRPQIETFPTIGSKL